MAEFWRSELLPYVESRRSSQSKQCYRPHSHHRFSIGLVDAGETTFRGGDKRPVILSAGDVIFMPAEHVHSCNPAQGPWEYQLIQLEQTWLKALLPEESHGLLDEIRVFRHDALYGEFCRINELLFGGAEAESIEAAFRSVLRECTKVAPVHRIVSSADLVFAKRLDGVLKRLQSDTSNPALEELADLAGLSKFQLIRVMKRATGFSPLAWRQNERVDAARALLREGGSLAETAHALGFADQSHFTRVFRAHVAASPGNYRL